MTQKDIWPWLAELCKDAEQYRPVMSLHIDEETQTVTLIADTARTTYMRWVEGARGDYGILYDVETDELAGVRFRLQNPYLLVHYAGPVKINEGFLKEEGG